MPLAELDRYRSLLVCPRCQSDLVSHGDGYKCIKSDACGSKPYTCLRTSGSWPVLVDFDNTVIDEAELLAQAGASTVQRRHVALFRTARGLLKARNNVAGARMSAMLRLLKRTPRRPLVLVVGGGSVGNGVEELYHSAAVDVLAFDIYATPYVQFVADAHSIPLTSESVDAVVVQAVLEHVLDPWAVVSEIARVLRSDGYVYSETPFLQHVHEGAWDFTRFTESGHRYLFRDFERLDSGWVAGVATQLYWSLISFARGAARNRAAGTFASVLFFWLPRLDRHMAPGFNIDGASCVFFFGKKATVRLTPKGAVSHYQGSQVP